jgi:ADP-ribose pyrophosphatase YjhB (NUDIX family)
MIIESAGLVVLHKQKILLVKPQGSNQNEFFSIPKGIIERSESAIDTAVRETYEETGVLISKEFINKQKMYIINYVNKSIVTKKVYYFFADISNMEMEEVLPIKTLQKSEIQYAAFFTKEEAKAIIFWRQEPILFQF